MNRHLKLSSGAVVLTAAIFFGIFSQVVAAPVSTTVQVEKVTSTRQQAIAFIDAIKQLDSSTFWPNIKPSSFLQNLKATIHDPVSIYPGNGTNFCGYGALSYLFLQ